MANIKRAGLFCRFHSNSLTTNRNRSLDNVTSIPRIQYMESGRVKEEDEASTDVESIDIPQSLLPRKSYVSSLRMEGTNNAYARSYRL